MIKWWVVQSWFALEQAGWYAAQVLEASASLPWKERLLHYQGKAAAASIVSMDLGHLEVCRSCLSWDDARIWPKLAPGPAFVFLPLALCLSLPAYPIPSHNNSMKLMRLIVTGPRSPSFMTEWRFKPEYSRSWTTTKSWFSWSWPLCGIVAPFNFVQFILKAIQAIVISCEK